MSINYDSILSDLKYKRSELDKAITHLENVHNRESVMIVTHGSIALLGVYEGAVRLLEEKGTSMKTDEIVEKIISSGKRFGSANPKASIRPTLYKALTDKKYCRLKKVGKGKWGLVDWGS